MLKRILFLLAIVSMASFSAMAQVTTSGITGSVKSPEGSGLTGATIKATHTPTGTVYTTTATGSGVFSLQGLRSGGPYTIEISFVGFPTKTLNDIYLTLGESQVINEQLEPASTELTNVVVTSTGRTSALNRFKTGASTNISNQQLNALPAINRSINDFTRLTPQANGNSFAGRDGRYNNVTVDGANFNNGFGLNDDPLPGGGGLSIDAIEEIQVNIAPYDVRQGGFTGAGINAVTKSGTNKFVGSVYHFFKNEGLIGRSIKGEPLGGLQESSTKTYGFRVGGPIIKNKLFFFVNAEQINYGGPSAGATNLWRASEDGIANESQNITRVRRSDLEAVRNHLVNQWGYDPGSYEGYAAKAESDVKSILARLDWNISNKHKLAVRYNSTENNRPFLANGNSGPNPRSPVNRVSLNSMAFENTMYSQTNTVKSYTLELNSRLSNRLSNQFLVTYSKIDALRTTNSAEFPMIDIGDGTNDGGATDIYSNYISAGYELFSFNNGVINNNLNIFNNLSYITGKHNFLFGVSYEMQKFGNSYQRSGTSYYRYKSVEDFLKTGTPGEVAPLNFSLTYVYPGMDPFAPVIYNLPAVYVQDNITVNDKFTLTAGLRVEMPTFKNNLTSNQSLDNLELLDVNGNATHYSSGKWPQTRVMVSPRVGFRYDVQGDKSLIIRGGTGIFAGRVPFVWLTNQPTNSGTIQNQVELGYNQIQGWIGDIRFQPEKHYWLNNTPASAQNVFIKSPNAGYPSNVALVAPNFKMPQIFRTNIGIDKKIGNSPFTVSADVMYTRDLYDVYQFGANRKASTEKMADGRDFYPNTASYQYNPAIGANNIQVLSNTTLGHSFNFTAGISMTPSKGFFGSLFYSHTTANTTTDNSGSNASSAWGATPNVSNPNDLFLASAADALPHRLVGSLSYRVSYLKHLATTFSLFYNGASLGRYSFTYSGDVNGDGIGNDLLYIPRNASEINFVQFTSSGRTFTVEEQRVAFDQLLSNSKYLDKHRGQMAERNGVLMPWYHRFDFKLLQDIFTNIGKTKNTLQFSLDIQNFGNFLNSDWGIQKSRISNTNIPLVRVGSGANPTFRLNTVSGNELPTTMYQDLRTFGTTWSIQVGFRYLFN